MNAFGGISTLAIEFTGYAPVTKPHHFADGCLRCEMARCVNYPIAILERYFEI
jgi:hypothetical protein